VKVVRTLLFLALIAILRLNSDSAYRIKNDRDYNAYQFVKNLTIRGTDYSQIKSFYHSLKHHYHENYLTVDMRMKGFNHAIEIDRETYRHTKEYDVVFLESDAPFSNSKRLYEKVHSDNYRKIFVRKALLHE